jgi:hypothetical protein
MVSKQVWVSRQKSQGRIFGKRRGFLPVSGWFPVGFQPSEPPKSPPASPVTARPGIFAGRCSDCVRHLNALAAVSHNGPVQIIRLSPVVTSSRVIKGRHAPSVVWRKIKSVVMSEVVMVFSPNLKRKS